MSNEEWCCEKCAKPIGRIINGIATATEEWSMSEDEKELCIDCYKKETTTEN